MASHQKCSQCGMKIPAEAEICPFCQNRTRRYWRNVSFMFIALVGIIFFLIFALLIA